MTSKCHVLKTSLESVRETAKISREGARHRSTEDLFVSSDALSKTQEINHFETFFLLRNKKQGKDVASGSNLQCFTYSEASDLP